MTRRILIFLCSLSLFGSIGPFQAFAAPLGAVKDFVKLSATDGGLGVIPDQDVNNFGVAVAAIGDLDNDGVIDLAVGDDYDDDGGANGVNSNMGAVWILFVNPDGTVRARQKISRTQGNFTGLSNASDSSSFGQAIAPLGDLDGDGVEDIIVGATRVDNPGASDSGALFVLFLRADGTVRAHQKIAPGVGGFGGSLGFADTFGNAFAVLGDLAGDGTVEIAVGNAGADVPVNSTGRIYILSLNEDGVVTASVTIGEGIGGFSGTLDAIDEFGTSLASLGDLNGDGIPDLAVGAHYDDDGEVNEGAVYLLMLSAGGTVASQIKINGETLGGVLGGVLDADDAFGRSLARLDGSVGVSGAAVVLAVGAPEDDDGGSRAGAVYLVSLGDQGAYLGYEKISLEQGCLGPVIHPNDYFGDAVASPGDLDGDGVPDLIAVTYDDNPSAQGAIYQLYLEGRPSRFGGGAETLVSEEPLTTLHSLEIASAGQGQSLVVWDDNPNAPTTGFDLFARTLQAGVLGPMSGVAESATGEQLSPAVIASGSDYLVAYHSDHLSYPANWIQVFLRKLDSSGTPSGPAVRLSTGVECKEGGPELAKNTAGSTAVVWSAGGCAGQLTSAKVVARAVDADLATLGAPFDLNDTGHVPTIDSLPSGDFAAAWRGDGDPSFIARGRRLSGTAPIGVPFQISETLAPTEFTQPGGVVRVGDDGSFMVVWASNLNPAGWVEVLGRVFSPPSYAGETTFRVAYVPTSPNTGAGGPRIARLTDGNVVVTWSAADLNGLGVYAQVISPSGEKIGPPVQVNVTTTGDQWFADVAPGPNGGFTVAWISEAVDGLAVHAREFSNGVCGNGTVNLAEQCDDGNTTNNDGCNSRCITEPEVSSCADTDVCNGAEVCDEYGLCQAGDPAATGVACEDGDEDTFGDECDGLGTCSPGADGIIYWSEAYDIAAAAPPCFERVSLLDGQLDLREVALDRVNSRLYWAKHGRVDGIHEIRRGDVHGLHMSNVVSFPADHPFGVDVDPSRNLVCWSESPSSLVGQIKCADLDGSNPYTLVSDSDTSIDTPTSVRFDSAAGKLYWSDPDRHEVKRIDLQSLVIETVVTGLCKPVGLDLDTTNNRMFVTNQNPCWTVDRISFSSAGFSGSPTVEAIVQAPADSEPIGIALDDSNGTIVFSTYGESPIKRATTEGSSFAPATTGGAVLAGWGVAVAGVVSAPNCCGDAVINVGSETCDDGNSSGGDGCSEVCAEESGWTCTGEPSDCDPDCGDGTVVGGEQCDDSNSAEGDCCSSSCQFEETGTSCADADVCDGAETCDGIGSCTAVPPATAGTPCPDADLCGGTEICDGSGTCQAGAPVSCDDGAACNGGETCDPGTGTCLPGTNLPPSTPCEDDGLTCTVDSCDGAGACAHTAGNAGTECRASAGQCDVAESCNGSSPTCPANGFVAADSDCDDGSDLTCPDKCDGSGTCVPGNDESTSCRNTCCDGVDNDGDESTDIEDSSCGLGQESRTAVVTTSPKRNAIRMGGRVNIASLDLEIDRPDCDEPYIYRTEAGICGERMSLRKNGEVGFIATLATEAVSGTQPVVFGKGFDIRSHWVSIGMPAESQEPPPLVGPGTCNPGGETCTQPLTPLDPGDACPSASAGACCPNPSALCEGRMDLFDPNNPHVITDGSHPDYARCQTLRTELALSSDAVAALTPNHPDYSNVDDPERIRVLPATPIPANCDNVDEDAAACTAACAQYCTVTLGAGQQVLYVDSIDVKRNMPLRLCRDFNLTPSDPPTVAIFRIEDKFALSPGARIEACGVPPDRILWNAEGEKGSVKFARGADLIGTVLAPHRKSIKFGGDATLKGSLFAPIVTFSKFTEMYHYPFSAGID